MRYGIQQNGDEWQVVDGEGNVLATFSSAAAALADVGQRFAADRDEETEAPRIAGYFRSMLAPEGVMTSDQRFIEADALYWRTPPLPYMLQTETEIGHFGAELAGAFTHVERQGSKVWGYGFLDDSEAGWRARDILESHGSYGISIDMGAMDADIECADEEDYDTCQLTVHAGEIIGATGTPFPAFAESFSEMDPDQEQPARDGEEAVAAAATEADEPCTDCENDDGAQWQPHRRVVVAAAVASRPPREWFDDPQLDRLTPLTIEGRRVYGHIAGWGVCHTGRADVCITAPRSSSGYPYFRTGSIICDDGEEIAVGQITHGTGHANTQLGFQAAAAHYDNTGSAVADVVAGEDAHGIWVNGALREGVDPGELRAASPSGDWRVIGGRHEMLAVLAVNVPGFPVPRVRAGMVADRQVSLVAAGIVPHLEPWEVALSSLEDRIVERLSSVSNLVHAVDRRTRPLVAAAQQSLKDRVARDSA